MGNDCVKESKFFEAAIIYTHALKQEPRNYQILSNRSLAFLKTDQYYNALQDANSVIKIQPDWPKVRKFRLDSCFSGNSWLLYIHGSYRSSETWKVPKITIFFFTQSLQKVKSP